MLLVRTVLLGLVAVATMAVSASSASAWTNPANYQFLGSLTSELELGGSPNPTLTCDIDFDDVDLSSGTANSGAVNSGTASTCTSTISASCVVTWSFLGLPSALSGVNTGAGNGRVIVDDAAFNWTYSGSGCPLSGTDFDVEGSVGGAYDDSSGALTFVDERGLVITRSNSALFPAGTDVSLTGTVAVQGDTIPELE